MCVFTLVPSAVDCVKVKKNTSQVRTGKVKGPEPMFRHHGKKAPTLLHNQGASESRYVQTLGHSPGDKVHILA